METIKPSLSEKLEPLEETRSFIWKTWGHEDYDETLEKQVKTNHSDVFRYMERNPTHNLGYSVISELYKLEETILNLKHQLLGWESVEDFLESELKKTE